MFDELTLKRIERTLAPLLQPRTRPHVKAGGTVAYRVTGQSIEVYSGRPAWDDPDEIIELPIAKFRYVRTRDTWYLYWNRADERWHGYQPMPDADRLDPLVQEVLDDPYGCFWG